MAKKDSLLVTHPNLAVEWDFEKNGDLTPEQVSKGQVRKVFWKCSKGHSYEARIDHRCSMNSGCPYCANKKVLVGENDLQTLYPDIAMEWAYDLNENAPGEYLPYSNKFVYWSCPLCNKKYKRKVIERTKKGFACPECMKESHTSQQEQALCYYLSQVTEVQNRAKVFGLEVDVFLPKYQIGIEYNGEYFHQNKQDKDDEKRKLLMKNGVRVILIACGRERMVEGDVITLQTKDKANPANEELTWGIRMAFELCKLPVPDVDIDKDIVDIYRLYVRSIKENSVTVKCPDIAQEWDFDHNKDLRPEAFAYASNKKVWWKCKVCGNSYQMQISNRTIGKSGCPFCVGKQIKKGFNDLETTHPLLMEEWDFEKNEQKPSERSKGSDKKAHWKCKICGYKWEASISSRVAGAGCPACAGKVVVLGYNDLKTVAPEVIGLWDYRKNENGPEQYTKGSNEKVSWICDRCGESWSAAVAQIVRGRRCPRCAIKQRGITRKENAKKQRNV